jgi:hypothetical protein
MEWKSVSDIPGYEQFTNFAISSTGELRHIKFDKIREWGKNKKGEKVTMHQDGYSRAIYKHVAMAALFSEPVAAVEVEVELGNSKLISEIPGFENFTNYSITINGEMRNVKLNRSLDGSIGTHGYHQYVLSQNGKTKGILQHFAIASLFLENPDGKPYVEHINKDDKLNNHITNLKWVSTGERTRADDLSSIQRSHNKSGAKNICATFSYGKPVWSIDMCIRGETYTSRFPRDVTSDEVPQPRAPQFVIDERDKMRKSIMDRLEKGKVAPVAGQPLILG